MPDLTVLYDLVAWLLPLDCLHYRFMQRALVGLVLLAPVAALMGVQVVNLRMAFFADAISHATFTGVALGLLFALDPGWTTLGFGVVVGLAITASRRRSDLSHDTVIGVFFAGVVAFGLVVVSRSPAVARSVPGFLYGDILTLDDADIWLLAVLGVAVLVFQVLAYNRLLYLGLDPVLARAHRIRVALYQYLFAGLLAFVVVFAARTAGVILAAALCIVPAATARNLSRSAGAMAWWALAVGLTSAVAGLLISAQPWAGTATGATVVLVAFACFLLSLALRILRLGGGR